MEKEIEEREIMTTEEDMDKNNNKNKKYDESRVYYVYKHVRLDNNTCFYIGKGKNGRKDDPNRNPTHDSICKEHEYKVVIFKDKLNEAEAFKLEEDLIRCYVFKMGYGICIKGYMNNNNKFLTNRTWGGEGSSGMHHTEEAKQIISEKNKGNVAWNKGKKGLQCHSEETKLKMSEERSGEKNGMYGKHHSEESKQKISEKMKVKMVGKNNPMYGKNAYANKTPEEMEEIRKKISEKASKKVVCITTGKIFNSIKDAEKHYSCGSISKCCKGKRNYAGKLQDGTKLQWVYLEDYNNEFKGILINPQ